ncbi:MAG TPA: FAD-binding oxidoreductase [Gaiellaceae bacterium]|nr:FAD-binding oxidoreductase [Gaiellaceae bacterium]
MPTSRAEASDRGLTRRALVERSAAVAASLAFPFGRYVPSVRDADPRIRALERALRGPVVTRGQARYERDRLVFCALYDDVRPLAVAHPFDAADVSAIVRWARKEGVHIVARSGGHSYGGYSTTRGVVVDLSRLAGVRVGGSRAVIGPGARLGVIYGALARHGKAIPAGTCPSVGIGGHALGGGFGLASRAWGLASDNLVSAEIVTADGAVVVVDPDRHPDLFWACRGGGGGNFGIVTRLVFRTHAVRQGSFFVASWPWAQVEEVLAAYLGWAPVAPDALGSVCRLAAGPGGPSVQVFGQFLGSERRLEAVLADLRPPASRLQIGTASWLDLVRRWAGCLGHTLPGCSAPGHQAFVGASDYIHRVPSPAQLRAFREVVEDRGAASGALLIDAYGGALNTVPAAATAFPHRDELASIQYFAAGDASSARAWVKSSRAALAHAVSGAAYVNYIDPALRSWQEAYYGRNLPRLQRIKRRHDPHDVFHFAQSIRLR